MFVIAGVTGHVGSVVAKRLLAAGLLAGGQSVRVVVRDAAKGAAWSSQGAEVAVGQLDDPRFLAEALRDAAGFFALLPDKVTGRRARRRRPASLVRGTPAAHAGNRAMGSGNIKATEAIA